MTKVDGTIIEDAEDLDLVMSMQNLLECIPNYSDTTVSLFFYSKDKETIFNADNADDNAFESFEYRTELMGNTVAQPPTNQANRILKNTKIVVNFWQSLEI